MWAHPHGNRGSAFTGAGAGEKVETARRMPRFIRTIPKILKEVVRCG
jgi:hypothetical protein